MIMVRGGSRTGSGRPRKDAAERRIYIGCRIKPELFQWLEEEKTRTEKGLGEIVDSALEALQGQVERTI